ncbi:site-specific integrase [Spirosoma sp. RP8]|uniref:Site-specific integrase n=1 Tax=Spirosoma liriopis TaxID=2937440 RepID=A0ABT0HWK7_9BACT|nr:site-specific integrase [Spirosoma liriopis]MCK8495905.1 site-specific integrase [Spirosoma liriopis]
MMFNKQVQKATKLVQQGAKVQFSKCSVNFFVRSRSSTIYYRVKVNGQFGTDRTTGIKAKLGEFNTESLVIKNNPSDSTRLNQLKNSILRVFTERDLTGRSLEPDVIRDIALGLRGHDSTIPSLIEGIELYLQQKELLLGNGLSVGSVKRYQGYRNLLVRFVTVTYGPKATFDQLKPALEHDLISYLKGNRGFSHNYALKVFQFLKTILEYAVSHEWAERNVLRTARLRKYYKPVETLTMDDLSQLKGIGLIEPNAAMVRDVFLFCCYTGMAYADVAELKAHHIVTVNEVKCVLKDRQKSGIQAFTPLFPEALSILDKYATNELCVMKGVLLPVLSNQKMNNWLKVIGNLAGIKKPLHTHLARKTFTMYAEELGFSLNDMATMLGHTHTAMTEKHYYQRRREPVISKFKSIFVNPDPQRQAS